MVPMMKRLLNLIFRKSRTGHNPTRHHAAPEVVRLGKHSLAKVNMEHWDPENQRAFRSAATALSNLRCYAGHVEHGYALRAVATAARCPRCQAETRQYYANVIYATQVAPRVMFAPAGYFCAHCPTVIVDEEMIRSGLTGPFTFQGVLGLEHDESTAPDFFRTWNGQAAVYLLDEDQTPQGRATMSPSQPSRRTKKRERSSGRHRMAQASRRRNQRKR
jgi:hypothetical protein